MTRIVAGTAKGRTLKVPDSGTRPTSDRVREALFSRLDHLGYLRGCAVLDMYAGSGALGLEAMSRGAVRAEFVESSASAARVIRDNARTLGFDVVVRAAKATAWVQGPADCQYDVVFLDPPYAVSEAEVAEVLDGLEPHVQPDALVVVERSSRSPEPAWPETWIPESQRTFGDTCLWFAFTGRLDS